MDLKDEIKGMMTGEGGPDEIEDPELDFGGDDGQQEGEEGEEGAEAGAEASGQEGEVAEGVEGEAELTVEERYARLLEEHNRQSSVLLEMINQHSQSQPMHRGPIGEIQATQPPASVVDPKFVVDKAVIHKAIMEGDADALCGVLEGLTNFVVERLSDQRDQLKERVLLELPTVAREVARNEFALFSAVKEFYAENKDLIPYQFIVGTVTNEIASKEPQLAVPDLLVKVEAETRKRLGLKKQIQEAQNAANRSAPAFGKPSNTRRIGRPRTESLRDDIAAMQNAKW